MPDQQDPIAAAADEEADLYDVATWEARSRLDRFAVGLSVWLGRLGRGTVVALALLILVAQLVLSGVSTISEPLVGGFIALSVVPAVLIVAFLWSTDVTEREPLSALTVTFVLGVLFASFAAVVNAAVDPLFARIPFVGLWAFYFVVVGPVEETVKVLAVQVYAFRQPGFAAVIDGAVYGAVAGLGFATIENAVYIGQGYLDASQTGVDTIVPTIQTAAVRSLAGPGHVIYSAFAGYYLGLAKFNRQHAGPLVVKGLLIASLVHAGYNSLVGVVPGGIAAATGLAWPIAFLGFVLVYDGVVGYALYRKIARYRRAYHETTQSSLGEQTAKLRHLGEKTVRLEVHGSGSGDADLSDVSGTSEADQVEESGRGETDRPEGEEKEAESEDGADPDAAPDGVGSGTDSFEYPDRK